MSEELQPDDGQTHAWGALAQARSWLVRAAERGQAPPRTSVTALDRWPEDLAALPADVMGAEAAAEAWGNLQLILVDGGQEGEHAAAWRRARRSAETAFAALLDRPEWGALREDLREEVLPRLAAAVGDVRWERLLRCREAIHRLNLLSRRTSGLPHAWRIARVTELAYPFIEPRGWRGRFGAEVTWRRLRAVVRALAACLREDGLGSLPLVIGHDSRVHADQLARLAAEVAAAAGQPVHLCGDDVPTPLLTAHLLSTLGVGHAAGVLACTASTLPVKDVVSGRYTGQGYQGLRYFTPVGALPPPAWCERVSRRAAELLLEPEPHAAGEPAAVTMIAPREAYLERLLTALHYQVITGEGEARPVLEALKAFWRQPEALIVIDALYGATRQTLADVCARLGLPCEVHRTVRDPLFGELAAANPEPPQLGDLIARVKEMRTERRPLIGIALDADGDRVGIVDEHGEFLSGHAVYALLADFLLNEAYPGEPGLLVRTREVARLADRLAAQPEYVDRVLAPPEEAAPTYLRAPGYRRVAGDPAALHGRAQHVVRDMPEAARLLFPAEGLHQMRGEKRRQALARLAHEQLDRLLLAGDGRGAVLALGYAPAPDGLWTALLLLALCAVRRRPLGALWRELQERIGPVHVNRLRLHAPNDVKRLLVNRNLHRFEKTGLELAGCAVRFIGGEPDHFVEWALTDPGGAPAYCAVTALDDVPQVHVSAEAATPDTTHRLLMAVARDLEGLITDDLHRAQHPWTVIEILADLQLPPAALADLPGTLNCRIVEHAYARLQELARPGLDAPELLRFVTDRLSEWQPEKAQAVAACRLDTQRAAPTSPRPPRIRWEDINEL